jgi:hypothetical protein
LIKSWSLRLAGSTPFDSSADPGDRLDSTERFSLRLSRELGLFFEHLCRCVFRALSVLSILPVVESSLMVSGISNIAPD